MGRRLQSSAPADELIDQADLALAPELGDDLGRALSNGRYAALGMALAIGPPGESIPTFDFSGMVHVIAVGARGLDLTTTLTNRREHTESAGAGGNRRAAGPGSGCRDFDGDGDDDLAIRVPGLDREGVSDVGDVLIAYGWDGFFGDSTAQPSVLPLRRGRLLADRQSLATSTRLTPHRPEHPWPTPGRVLR